jgi:hypothetical protein
MGFRCEKCTLAFPNETQPEHRPVRVVTAVRAKQYGSHHGDVILGFEPAREANLCASCASTHVAPKADMSTVLIKDRPAPEYDDAP